MDAWVDAKGTFMAGVGSDPVYRLLGKNGLGTTQLPKMETGLMDGDLAFRHHAGPHTDAPNWTGVHRVRGAAVQDEEVA